MTSRQENHSSKGIEFNGNLFIEGTEPLQQIQPDRAVIPGATIECEGTDYLKVQLSECDSEGKKIERTRIEKRIKYVTPEAMITVKNDRGELEITLVPRSNNHSDQTR